MHLHFHLLPLLTYAILLLLLSPPPTTATSLTIHNTSPKPICYSTELSTGTFPTTTTCGPASLPGISVHPGQKTSIALASTFNGALTAWIANTTAGKNGNKGNNGDNNNSIRGARYEINFAAANPAGSTWYDADYQLGMSDGTLGPLDNRRLDNGQSSLSGEPDALAKANAAWPPPPHTQDKATLLSYPDYLRQGADGKLSFVYCDAQAPAIVVEFLQVTAAFDAYVDAGSVAGGSGGDEAGVEGEAVRMADERSLVVGTQEMLIVAY